MFSTAFYKRSLTVRGVGGLSNSWFYSRIAFPTANFYYRKHISLAFFRARSAFFVIYFVIFLNARFLRFLYRTFSLLIAILLASVILVLTCSIS